MSIKGMNDRGIIWLHSQSLNRKNGKTSHYSDSGVFTHYSKMVIPTATVVATSEQAKSATFCFLLVVVH